MGFRYSEDSRPDWNALLGRAKARGISDDERSFRQAQLQLQREQGDIIAKSEEQRSAPWVSARETVPRCLDEKAKFEERAQRKALTEEQLAAQRLQRGLDEKYSGRERETGLRTQAAQADTMERAAARDAKFGDRKAEAEIAGAEAGARSAGTQADILEATGMETAQANTRTAKAEATTAEAQAKTAPQMAQAALEQLRSGNALTQTQIKAIPLQQRVMMANALNAETNAALAGRQLDQSLIDQNIRQFKAVLSQAGNQEQHKEAVDRMIASGAAPWQVAAAIEEMRVDKQQKDFFSAQIAQSSPAYQMQVETYRDVRDLAKNSRIAISQVKMLRDRLAQGAGKTITPADFKQAREDVIKTLENAGQSVMANEFASNWSLDNWTSLGYKSDKTLIDELDKQIKNMSQSAASAISSVAQSDATLANQVPYFTRGLYAGDDVNPFMGVGPGAAPAPQPLQIPVSGGPFIPTPGGGQSTTKPANMTTAPGQDWKNGFTYRNRTVSR